MECGEGKQKEVEEIVFMLLLCRSKRVTERCIRCSLAPIPPGARLFGPSTHNPRVVHQTPSVRAVVWF